MSQSNVTTPSDLQPSTTAVDTSPNTYGCCIEYDMDCRHNIEKPRRYKNTSSTEMYTVKTAETASTPAPLVVISSSANSSSAPSNAGKQT